MNRSTVLSLPLLMLFSALAPAAGRSQTGVGVEITSQLTGTVAGAGRVELKLVGPAVHTLNGRRVIFTAKRLVAVEPGDFGPVTVTLNPGRQSVGTLASEKFPTEHRQNFFLLIRSEKLGTLVSDAPLTLSARIESSPPTATYKSDGKPVAFYKQGDSRKTPVLTIETVESDVTPGKQ